MALGYTILRVKQDQYSLLEVAGVPCGLRLENSMMVRQDQFSLLEAATVRCGRLTVSHKIPRAKWELCHN